MESVRTRAVGAMKSGTLLALRLGNKAYLLAAFFDTQIRLDDVPRVVLLRTKLHMKNL